MKHVDFSGKRGTITINEQANVKAADGPKPVTWSRGYVANWLDVHPRPNNPEAALTHKTRQWDGDEHGALTQQYAGRRVKEIAGHAGLDVDRVHAHLFRGTAISDWIREGMSEQAIKHRVSWSKDSRMFGTYSRVTDEEMNDVVFDHYGIEGEGETKRPDLDECTQCHTPLRGGENFCPSCAAPLNQTASDEVEAVEDETFESATAADTTDGDLFAEFRRRFNTRPEFRERVVSDGDHDASS